MTEIKILINGVDRTDVIDLESGFTFKETITDELDSKTCVFLVSENNKELINVNDKIEIWRKVNGKFIDKQSYLIGATEKELFTKAEPIYYKVIAVLLELTKILERIVLSPCAFTNPNDTLWNIFDKALGKAIIRRNDEPSKFIVSRGIKSLLDSAGEDFIYNQPTILRDILDDILIIRGACVVVNEIENGKIYLDYRMLDNSNVNPITLSRKDLKNIKILDSYENKASEYETFVNGVISPDPIEDEYKTFKPENIEIITTENEYYHFNYPIEHLVKFECMVKMRLFFYDELPPINPNELWTPIYEEDRFVVVDIASDILEENIFNLKSSQEQQFLLSYTKGSKTMNLLRRRGIFDVSILQGRIGWHLKMLWQNWNNDPTFLGQYRYVRAQPYTKNNELLNIPVNIGANYEDCVFKATYYAYLDQHYSITKDDNKCGTLIKTPSETMIDSNRYANKMYNEAFSKGNPQYQLDFLYDNAEQLGRLEIGNKILYDNRVLTLTEMEKGYHKDFVKAHLVFEENYVPETTEKLTRERQIFKNPINNIIERNILIKDNVSFGAQNISVEDSNCFLLRNKLLQAITTNDIKFAKCLSYYLPVTKQLLNNSILYNFGFKDNYSAGYSVGDKVVGGYKVNLNSYVDENGEKLYIDISFYSSLLKGQSSINNIININDDLPIFNNEYLNRQIIQYSKSPANFLNIDKDRLEHITFTYQLEFLSNNCVIIGKNFIKLLKENNFNVDNLYIYTSSDEIYKNSDIGKCKGIRLSKHPTFYEGFNIGSNLSSNELSQAESWGVGDKNGNLLLGVNNKKLSTSIIFTRYYVENEPVSIENYVRFYDFQGTGNTLLKTEKVISGGNATPPADPVRTGYQFTGWSPPYTNIARNTDIYGQWVLASTNYVRFVSAEARTITPKYTNSGITLEYSVDSGATWTTIASGASTTSATEHWFRGEATGTKSLFTAYNSTNAWAFSGSSDLEVYGNLNFLLCDTLGDEEAPTSLGTYCYNNMFFGCTSLTTAPELPATTLATHCYSSMFYGCTSLIKAPELPATTLATECYNQMFRGCTSLTTAPELPATTLASSCYSYMFYYCTSLTTAPKLPATTLASSCYSYMFYYCTSLTTAPELPATTMVYRCYYYMFSRCTSLTTAPELPATTLESNCYSGMFRGCTSLTTAPELPATTLADYCYANMFRECRSLTTAPKLPATTMVYRCYYYMFSLCTAFKVSKTNAGSYTYAWRIPTSGTGTTATDWNSGMLLNTGGTFTGYPSINTTYWVENEPV